MHLIGRAAWKRLAMSSTASVTAVRLGKITGYDDRRNSIIYTRPKINPASSIVVFFPGDVQNYPEIMETDKENNQHTRWNLESVSYLLCDRFEHSHIVVVMPSRMELKVFSCYDNFVPNNNLGVPSHVPMHHALLHLELLLRMISRNVGDETSELSALNIILVGFSKGCVVLNQFLHEIHYMTTSRTVLPIVRRITSIYWLDGGHSGGKNTWITSKRILSSFAKLGIVVNIHLTPYQLDDKRRPWIKKEEKSFRDTLDTLGVTVNRSVHFDNQPPSLDKHFEVLNVFR